MRSVLKDSNFKKLNEKSRSSFYHKVLGYPKYLEYGTHIPCLLQCRTKAEIYFKIFM